MKLMLLPAGAALLVFLIYLFSERPFSELNRAKRRAGRDMERRVAELIERGYSEWYANEVAREERTREAERVSRLLVSEGFEP